MIGTLKRPVDRRRSSRGEASTLLAAIEQSNERRLPSDYRGDLVLFDIDKTYLDTRFSSLRGLLGIPFEFAIDKETIPGAATLLRALRRGPGEESAIVPLYFVSGSPPELRRVIERKMILDGVEYDGITFKDQRKLLFSGHPGLIRAQLPYKLASLLLYKRAFPEGARWLLFGDDVERDAEAFLLFGAVCGGFRGPALSRDLRARGVGARLAEDLVTLAASLPSGADPVDRIFIHLSQRLEPARSADPRLVETRSYLQTALVLAALGKVRRETIGAVAKELRLRHVPEVILLEHLKDAAARLEIPNALIALAHQ